MKTSIIPIFIPHIGCPYRCVFCNQWRITGRRGVPDGNAVARTIKEYVTSAAEGYSDGLAGRAAGAGL